MAKESKTLFGALLTPSLVTTLPMGRLVKLTDDLESFRELIDCKTIEHLSMGWAPGVVLDAFMDEEGMLASLSEHIGNLGHREILLLHY